MRIFDVFMRYLDVFLLVGSLTTIAIAIIFRNRIRFFKTLIVLAFAVPILVILVTPIYHGDYKERACEAERRFLIEKGRLDQLSPMCLPEHKRPMQCPLCK